MTQAIADSLLNVNAQNVPIPISASVPAPKPAPKKLPKSAPKTASRSKSSKAPRSEPATISRPAAAQKTNHDAVDPMVTMFQRSNTICKVPPNRKKKNEELVVLNSAPNSDHLPGVLDSLSFEGSAPMGSKQRVAHKTNATIKAFRPKIGSKSPESDTASTASSTSSSNSTSKKVPAKKNCSGSVKATSVPSTDLTSSPADSRVELHTTGSGSPQLDTATSNDSNKAGTGVKTTTAKKSSSKPLSKIAAYKKRLESNYKACRATVGLKNPQLENSKSPQSDSSSKSSTASSSRSSSSLKKTSVNSTNSSLARSSLHNTCLNNSSKSKTIAEKKLHANPAGVSAASTSNDNKTKESTAAGRSGRAVFNPSSKGTKTTKTIAPIAVIAPQKFVTPRMKLLNQIYGQ